jgi:membrane fusion protein, multidrug efflux system
MTKRIILFFLAVLATLGLLAAGCKKAAGPAGSGAGGFPPAAVTVNQPDKREIVEWDEYPGHLEAVDMVEVRAKVSGYLDSVNFKDGAEVKKGDLLFVIDPRPYKSDLDRAQADIVMASTRFELASNDYDRAERLLKSKAISEEDADSRSKAKREAAAAIQSSQASLEMAKLNMEYTHIAAPIDGRIGRKLITEGNLINGNQGQTTPLTTIVSLDPIYCYFDADEGAVLKYQQLARDGSGADFREGKVPCELELANETNFPHKGVLDFMDNQMDATTGTLRVRGTFTNPAPDHVLQPGFFVRIRVPGSTKHQALLIPDLAVGTDQGQKFVYVVNGENTVEYKRVMLGPVYEGLRVVRSGVQPDDWIIVNGLMSVRPGSKVNPARAAIGAAPAQPQATAKQ